MNIEVRRTCQLAPWISSIVDFCSFSVLVLHTIRFHGPFTWGSTAARALCPPKSHPFWFQNHFPPPFPLHSPLLPWSPAATSFNRSERKTKTSRRAQSSDNSIYFAPWLIDSLLAYSKSVLEHYMNIATRQYAYSCIVMSRSGGGGGMQTKFRPLF